VPLPPEATRRVHDTSYLSLAQYGLRPGDEIKLFARVTDNDPARAKGSESTVVTVSILSQEEYERMLRARECLDVLMSKYRQAQRRLESIASQLKELREKTEKQPKKELASKRQREDMRKLIAQLEREAVRIAASAQHLLPYDVDGNLSPKLRELAEQLQAAAGELERLQDRQTLNNEELAGELARLASQLGQQSDLYGEGVLMPLEQLELVFPLIADQARFVQIVRRQRDLAERLAALKGRDAGDDPALKARMRDLDEEQREVREDLDTLLKDIEDHVQLLPEDEQFERLRETATEFVDAVRQSGAAEAMAEAEGALAGFLGTRAHEKANEAAEILERFLSDCEGMGQRAGDCLVFRPGMGQCMGNTVAQLLTEMGMGMGTGSGSGFGAGGGSGFSARRGAMRNVGLYGGMPGRTGTGGDQFGQSGEGRDERGGGSSEGSRTETSFLSDIPGLGESAGVGQAAVPLRYRKRVGQYFRRVAEGLEE
jgi:hypothetical protein